jgi:Fic family protein
MVSDTYTNVTFTETKARSGKLYYYRTLSRRIDGRVRKERIYLGRDLSSIQLEQLEHRADLRLSDLDGTLSQEELEEVDRAVIRFRDLPLETSRDRYEDFLVRFTHDSTSIEGNTLSLEDTRSLIFEGVTPSSKTMREIHEVMGHRKAFDRILKPPKKLDNKWIQEIHSVLMLNSSGSLGGKNAGRYRKVNVGLRGSDVEFPDHEEVPERMKDLMVWYNRKGRALHPLITAAKFHVEFEMIHPFTDGNGRIGRLLMNQILHSRAYPMINIPKRSKVDYFLSLRKAQDGGEIRPFLDILLNLLRTQRTIF